MNRTNIDIAEAAIAIACIPADDRETWIKVGMGLQSAYGDRGFPVWDRWSSSSEKYQPRTMRSTWRTFRSRPGGITMRTVLRLARLHGWRGDETGNPVKPGETRDRERRDTAKRRQREADYERRRQTAIKSWIADMEAKAEFKTHRYLADKGFPDLRWRVLPPESPHETERLVVPMRNAKTGGLQGVQTIQTDGTKKFVFGSRASGAAHRFGVGSMGPRVYCEGFASGLSIQRALRAIRDDSDVFVCFSAGNIRRVTELTRIRGVPQIVVADHDPSRCGSCGHRGGIGLTDPCPQCGEPSDIMRNPGAAAAARTGLPYWMPPEVGSDANDFEQAHGRQALSWAIYDKLYKGEKTCL